MNEHDRLVFLTLAYSSCFAFALNKKEIAQRLAKGDQKISTSSKKIEESLKKLMSNSLIQSEHDYFFLRKRDLSNRLQRAKFVPQKQKEIQAFVALASKIPFVKAIVLTGSTAVGNAQKEDDLDFMIICQNNRLWLTRLILILLTKFKAKRPEKENSNAWCLNLWLDEGDLVIREERRSLYEAYEILQMNFVYDAGNLQRQFLNANSWLSKYLFFYDDYKFGRYKIKKSFSLLNQLFFILQKKYRQLVFGQENFSLSLTQAFFNSISFRAKVFSKLKEKMEGFEL